MLVTPAGTALDSDVSLAPVATVECRTSVVNADCVSKSVDLKGMRLLAGEIGYSVSWIPTHNISAPTQRIPNEW